MKKKITPLAIILILTIMVFCGCNEQQNNNNGLDIGLTDTFSVDSTGGDFSIFDDNVMLNIQAESVTETVDITVETINNPVEDPDLIMFSCFEFGPDGTTFNKPIDLIIRYNADNLPDGVEENDIKIYLLNEGEWEVIDDSFANEAMGWSVASITHFCKMGGGAPAPSNNDNNNGNGNDDSDDENGSAQIWFKPNIEIGQYSYRGPGCGPYYEDKKSHTEYTTYAVIWWDPISYVHYYNLKYEFNGNPPKPTAPSCNFRDWGKYWCELKTPWGPDEGYIYNLGGDPNLEGYSGTFDNPGKIVCEYIDGDDMKEVFRHRIWPEGKHGFTFFLIHDQVRDAEELTEYDTLNLENEMLAYVQDYIDKWEIWVRGVTETLG